MGNFVKLRISEWIRLENSPFFHREMLEKPNLFPKNVKSPSHSQTKRMLFHWKSQIVLKANKRSQLWQLPKFNLSKRNHRQRKVQIFFVKHSSPQLYLDFISLAPQITAVFLWCFSPARGEQGTRVHPGKLCSGNPGVKICGEIVMPWHPKTCVTQPFLKESCTVFSDFFWTKRLFINQKLSPA